MCRVACVDSLFPVIELPRMHLRYVFGTDSLDPMAAAAFQQCSRSARLC